MAEERETSSPTIDATLVERLVAAQLPHLAHLPVRPVERQGNDNRTFRLGPDLVVRLPSAAGYVGAIAVEDRWLPELAPHLPVPVPEPVAVGEPGDGYPFPWAVRRWVPGEPLEPMSIASDAFAADVGAFLRALHRIPAAAGPPAGERTFHRGAHLGVYDADVRRALGAIGWTIDADAAEAIWEQALAWSWHEAPVWVHGDVAATNLLQVDGRLAGVIDFGQLGVGDPACDLVLAWTGLDASGRRVLRDAVGLDDDTWRRARAWALWKALVTLADPDAAQRDVQARALAAVLADPIVDER